MKRAPALIGVALLGLLPSCAPRRGVATDRYATVTVGDETRELHEPASSDGDADSDDDPLADAERALSLEAATVLALERNTELAVQRLNPAIAETFEATERAEFGATLFADGQYGQELSRVTNRATMMQFDVEGSDTTASVGVRQRAPTGTQVETSIGFRRDASDRAPEQQELRVGVTVTQSLLNGIEPDANLARVRQARLEVHATRHQLRAFVTATLLEVETTYWGLALATRTAAIQEHSLALAEQEAEAVRARIEVGDLAPADAPVARAEVALRRRALIDARAEIEALRHRLARLLRAGGRAEAIEVTDAVRIDPSPIDDPAAHHRVALRARPDLAEARVRLEQNQLETVRTANGLLPRLDLFVQLTKTGFGSSFGDAVLALGEPTYEVAVGLRFEQLLGNAAASAEDRRANLDRERAARAIENLEGLVRLDVALALNEIERARAQIEATADSVARLEEVVAAERERVAVGESTALSLARSERDLVQAQVAEVAAHVAYRVALVRLYASEGSLLERRGVTLGEDG